MILKVYAICGKYNGEPRYYAFCSVGTWWVDPSAFPMICFFKRRKSAEEKVLTISERDRECYDDIEVIEIKLKVESEND